MWNQIWEYDMYCGKGWLIKPILWCPSLCEAIGYYLKLFGGRNRRTWPLGSLHNIEQRNGRQDMKTLTDMTSYPTTTSSHQHDSEQTLVETANRSDSLDNSNKRTAIKATSALTAPGQRILSDSLTVCFLSGFAPVGWHGQVHPWL